MRTTLITGASRGIGLEFCRQFAADGWKVIACCRDPGKSEALNKVETQYPDTVRVIRLDVGDISMIEQLARDLTEESLDLLINNAGVYPDSDRLGFGHTNYTEWIQAFGVNTMAPLKMAEALAGRLSQGTIKAIVTITSKMGSIADNAGGGNYLYRSSKAAVNMVVKSLAIDLKPLGIKAVVIHPGWVKTDMGGPNAMITPEQSVRGMRQLIDRLTLADSGKFFSYDGLVIPW